MTEAFLLDAQRPTFKADAAERVALEAYGVAGTCRPLPSERDQNFLVTAASGERYVLKIAGAAEARGVLDLQNAALAHIAERDPEIPVSRVVPTRSGAPVHPATVGNVTHLVRMLTYLPGRPLAQARPRHPRLLRELGRLLGRLSRALDGFTHGAARRDLYWDLSRAPDVITRHLGAVADPARRAIVECVLERWAEVVAPAIDTLDRSVIYNDANDYNVLVDGSPAQRVTGFVDFGDMLESATVCEPAIAAAYAMLDAADLPGAAADVVAGYHAERALSDIELAVLPVLIAARLAVSVSVSAQRRLEEPDNAYLTISERPAWDALERLSRTPARLVTYRFRAACGLEPVPQGKQVVDWLTTHAGAFGPVLDPDPRQGPTVTLDLSVGTPDLDDPIAIAGTPAFSERVAEVMRDARAEIGIGRYDEARLLYAEGAFEASPGGSPERRTVHLGADLFAEAGSAVRAPLDGTVQSVRDNAGRLDYGPTVVLEHAPGDGVRFHTLYGHLDPACLERLEPGMSVTRGTTFAHLGDFAVNGNWPPHLHFQIVLDLLDRVGEFPGVAAPRERSVWLALSPDPNLILRLPGGVRAGVAAAPERLLAVRHERLGPSLRLAYDTPIHVVRGRGQCLYDAEGRAFLDCVNNVCHVGHCHPEVVRALREQAAVLNTNTRYLHERILEYADRLTASLPDPLGVCYFVCSGSEANELALRIARAHTGRSGLVVLEGAYHGNTTALVDASPYKFDGPGGRGAPPHVYAAAMPDDYRGPYRRDDPERATKFAAHVAEAVARARDDGRDAGAFLCESLLGCGGQIEPPPGYLAAAYDHAREAGALCIADEVQVGFGRVGTEFWGFATQDVIPDIVTLGKPIGNGHPIGAVVTTPEIAAAFDTGMEYFNTFGGNPVSCAVGLAVLDVIEREGLQRRALEVGTRLKEGLRALMDSHPVVGDVRGRGLFLGVELVASRDTRAPAPGAARYVVERMKDLGVLLSTDGPDRNVLKIKPPLPFSEADADHLIETLHGVLQEDVPCP